MTVITFDFDNTIVMSHMLIKENKPVFVFDGFNNAIITKIKQLIAEDKEVHIVTARSKDKEELFPDFSIPVFLMELSLDDYFTPDRVHYTDGELKLEILQKLGSVLHYDDSLEEFKNNYGKIKVKSPYDYYEDSSEVGKAIIFDADDRILLLRRTDEGKKWDIPGGHLKEIEIKRPFGSIEGTEREVMEETGLLLPYLEEIGSELFSWKGKTNNIGFFQTKIEQKMPNVNLNLQSFQENSEYRWVSIDEMFKYGKNGTQILRKAIELVKNHGLITEKSRIQLKYQTKHRKMKEKLIGLGKNKHFGGGKGHKKPKMSRSKSAPPGFGAIGEENDKKKRKIRVRIVDNIDEKRKKRRKKRKDKRKKTVYHSKKRQKRAKKRRNRGSNWPYIGGFIADFGDSGGDAGGGE